MLFKKKESWVILGICVGFLALSAISFLNTRSNLKRYEQATNAAWAALESAVRSQAEAVGTLLADLRSRPEAADAMEAVVRARDALAQARGPQAEAVAYNQLWRQTEQLLSLAEGTNDAKLGATIARLRSGHRQVEECATRYNATARQYEIKLRKTPDSRVVEGLGLRAREYFKLPDVTASDG